MKPLLMDAINRARFQGTRKGYPPAPLARRQYHGRMMKAAFTIPRMRLANPTKFLLRSSISYVETIFNSALGSYLTTSLCQGYHARKKTIHDALESGGTFDDGFHGQ